jgi:hypothetical protein
MVIEVDNYQETINCMIQFGLEWDNLLELIEFSKKLKRFTLSWEKSFQDKYKVRIIRFLQSCVNLEEITLTTIDVFKENHHHFLPKLKKITKENARLDETR